MQVLIVLFGSRPTLKQVIKTLLEMLTNNAYIILHTGSSHFTHCCFARVIYLLPQLLFSIVLFNGDLAISFKSFVELVSDVPFHALCSTIITDAADMSPASGITDAPTITSKRHTVLEMDGDDWIYSLTSTNLFSAQNKKPFK